MAVLADDTSPVPPTIPCVEELNVPCINAATQSGGSGTGGTLDYILNTYGPNFLTGFVGIVAVSAVIFIIVGGVQMLTSAGNEEQVKTGQKTLLWAIIGLVASILAVAAVRIISNLFVK
jgi:hypothetical protein